MQAYAYEGYFENGQVYISTQTAHIKGKRKVFITILDEPIDGVSVIKSKTQQERWAKMEKWRGTVRSNIDEKAELEEARDKKYG